MSKIVRMIGRIARKLETSLGRLMRSFAGSHPIARCRLLSARLLDGDVDISPSPGDIVRAIRRRATDIAAVWDYGKGTETMCPNRFEVRVPDAVWRSFYGNSTEFLCARIESMVHDDLLRRLACNVMPTVILMPDMSLLDGELMVNATFLSEDNAVAKEPSDTKSGKEFSNEDDSPEKEKGDVGPLEMTPAMAPSMPHIALRFEMRRFPVRDGSVIGVHRRDKTSTADIELPYSDDLYWVSQEHGRFVFDPERQAWLYQQLGSNGSALVHGDKTQSLGPGEEAELAEGDMLALAGSRKMLVVIDDSAERTVARPAA